MYLCRVLMQVGCLDRDLLAERTSHDKQRENLVIRHETEMNTLREKSRTQLRELRESVNKMKEDQMKVRPIALPYANKSSDVR